MRGRRRRPFAEMWTTTLSSDWMRVSGSPNWEKLRKGGGQHGLRATRDREPTLNSLICEARNRESARLMVMILTLSYPSSSPRPWSEAGLNSYLKASESENLALTP